MLGGFFYQLPPKRTPQPATAPPAPAPGGTSKPPPPRNVAQTARRFYDKFNAGAGSWYTLHLLAACGKRAALADTIECFERRFTCARCRPHIAAFVKARPLPVDTVDCKTLFLWTVEFHNEVNRRLTAESGYDMPTVTGKGADILFHELTQGADSDSVQLAISGSCDGCDAPVARGAHPDGVLMTSLVPTENAAPTITAVPSTVL